VLDRGTMRHYVESLCEVSLGMRKYGKIKREGPFFSKIPVVWALPSSLRRSMTGTEVISSGVTPVST
jgi:hypothetical protein